MKALISNTMKAIRSGEFVQANHDSDEFIFDSELPAEEQHAKATLIEVAKSNGLVISSKAKAADIVEQLAAHLETLKLPKVDKMTDTQKVEQAIDAGIAAGKTDDDILVDIINDGVSFKNAGKLFKAVMEAKGLRVSAKDRAEQAAAILTGADFGAADENGESAEVTAELVAEMVAKITGEIDNTSDKQAMAAIRKYAKEMKFELPKAPKGGAGRVSGGGILVKMTDWMLNNREADAKLIEAQIRSIKEDITDGQLKKYMGHCERMMAFAKRWVA